MSQILVFPDDKYDNLMDVMAANGKKIDDVAMCALHKDFCYIILRESFVEESDSDVVAIVVAHELAHASGIEDEEEADRAALKTLTEIQRGYLIEAWEERHGHIYNSMEV